MAASPEKTPRKRGRPPMTKTYDNLLENPLAQSSLKVKQQASQLFSKPTMKVGHLTPKAKKRRTSNAGSLFTSDSSHKITSSTKDGNLTNVTSSSKAIAVGTTKKGRYRGVILSTPVKSSSGSSGSNHSTPGNKEKSSHSGKHKISGNNLPLTPVTDKSQKISMLSEKKNQQNMNFSLSLNINSNGKATIGSSPNGSIPQQLPVSNAPDTNFQKRDILFLLKKMKNHTSNKYKKPSITKDIIKKSKNNTLDSKLAPLRLERAFNSNNINIMNNDVTALDKQITDPKKLIPCTPPPPAPMSPANFFNSQWKTGLTPNINGSLGMLSPFRMSLGNNHIISVPTPSWPAKNVEDDTSDKDTQSRKKPEENDTTSKQNGMKYFVGDPLLLTDDSAIGEQVWQENNNIRSHALSPAHTKVFNTPPSFVTFGSPGSLLFSPPSQRRNSSILAITNTEAMDQHNTHMNMLRNHHQKINGLGKLKESLFKSPIFKTTAVPLDVKDDTTILATNNGLDAMMSDLTQYHTKGNNISHADNIPDVSEESSPLMPHSGNDINKIQLQSASNELKIITKLTNDTKDIDTPGFERMNGENTDDAGLALKNLITEDHHITSQ
ncbi:hypothetical protein C6P45_004747 [Maudiozyma exigua]|uniref:Uncharacterized protein n=1 Tax=Maudiozyma exigua TaxID=34358 RepID=A0A9P6WE68_MAUEX|nr:hypothetical protein C6P45_004747 [Kazachstania exigua]